MYRKYSEVKMGAIDPNSNCRNSIVFFKRYTARMLVPNKIIKRLIALVNYTISNQDKLIPCIEVGADANIVGK